MSKKKPFLLLYAVGPFDWWSGWIDLTKFKPSDFVVEYDDPASFEAQVASVLKEAKLLALDAGWEGDMVQGPYLTAIPNDDNDVKLAVAWKQRNNGSTFIASEVALPHIETKPHTRG